MRIEKEGLLSRNTPTKRLAAPFNTRMGVAIITAPMVPPNTIIAAVNWRMSLILPPSISRPPKIPPKASTNPRSVARSGLPPGAFAPFFPAAGFASSAILGFHARLRGHAGNCRHNFPPVGDYLVDDLPRGIQHHEFLPVG